eukprot:jgi/Botrbrau1/23243/Bobra.0041s0079.1
MKEEGGVSHLGHGGTVRERSNFSKAWRRSIGCARVGINCVGLAGSTDRLHDGANPYGEPDRHTETRQSTPAPPRRRMVSREGRRQNSDAHDHTAPRIQQSLHAPNKFFL